MLLAAIGASAWNIVGGYAGQVSVGHAVFFGFGAYSAVVVYTHLGWLPIAGAPIGMVLSVALAAMIGVPTFALRPLFQHGHHRRRRAGARSGARPRIPRRRNRSRRAWPCRAPSFDLSFISAMPFYYIFLAVLAFLLGWTWWMSAPLGFTCAPSRIGARRPLARRLVRSLQAPMPTC